MTRNVLLIGDLVSSLRHLANDLATVAWVEWRTLAPSQDFEQLCLFEGDKSALLSSDFTEPSFLALSELTRVLKSTGHLFVLCDATLSHRVRNTLDKLLGSSQFRFELPLSLRGALSAGSFPTTSMIVYAKTSRAALRPSLLGEGNRDHIYRYVDPDSGRRYTLAACVRPHVDDSRFTYEWNGFRRTWRWTRKEFNSLFSQGKIVLTRSGMPRLKRYLDETARRSPTWDIAWFKTASTTNAPDEALARLIVQTALSDRDVIVDASPRHAKLIQAANAMSAKWAAIARDHEHAARLRHELWHNGLDDDDLLVEPQDVGSATKLANDDPKQFKYWALGQIGAQFSGHQPIIGFHHGSVVLPSRQTSVPVFVSASSVSVSDVRHVQKARRASKVPIAIVISQDRKRHVDALARASARDVAFVTVRELLSMRRRDLLEKIEERLDQRRPQKVTLRRSRRATA